MFILIFVAGLVMLSTDVGGVCGKVACGRMKTSKGYAGLAMMLFAFLVGGPIFACLSFGSCTCNFMPGWLLSVLSPCLGYPNPYWDDVAVGEATTVGLTEASSGAVELQASHGAVGAATRFDFRAQLSGTVPLVHASDLKSVLTSASSQEKEPTDFGRKDGMECAFFNSYQEGPLFALSRPPFNYDSFTVGFSFFLEAARGKRRFGSGSMALLQCCTSNNGSNMGLWLKADDVQPASCFSIWIGENYASTLLAESVAYDRWHTLVVSLHRHDREANKEAFTKVVEKYYLDGTLTVDSLLDGKPLKRVHPRVQQRNDAKFQQRHGDIHFFIGSFGMGGNGNDKFCGYVSDMRVYGAHIPDQLLEEARV